MASIRVTGARIMSHFRMVAGLSSRSDMDLVAEVKVLVFSLPVLITEGVGSIKTFDCLGAVLEMLVTCFFADRGLPAGAAALARKAAAADRPLEPDPLVCVRGFDCVLCAGPGPKSPLLTAAGAEAAFLRRTGLVAFAGATTA